MSQASYPVVFLARGKADTRARKATGCDARSAAPERLPARARSAHGASGIDDPDRIRRTSRASRWPVGERHRALTVGSCDQLGPAEQPHSKLGLVDDACAVRRFRPAENEPRRRLSGVRSGTFPRARVCLSKPGERYRIERLSPRSQPASQARKGPRSRRGIPWLESVQPCGYLRA